MPKRLAGWRQIQMVLLKQDQQIEFALYHQSRQQDVKANMGSDAFSYKIDAGYRSSDIGSNAYTPIGPIPGPPPPCGIQKVLWRLR
jgi:hypothetical protein